MTISFRRTRRSIAAIPVDHCSTWTAGDRHQFGVYSPTGGSVGIRFHFRQCREECHPLSSNPAARFMARLARRCIQRVSDEIAQTMGLDKPRGAIPA
jgi:hypothetical protein